MLLPVRFFSIYKAADLGCLLDFCNNSKKRTCHFREKLEMFFSVPVIYIYNFHCYEYRHFGITANDRGYGHGRFAGVFAVAQRQSECERKTC